MTLRIAVLVSGRGSNLQALLDAIANTTLDARIVGVFSDRPDAMALQRVAPSLRWSEAAKSFPDRTSFDHALAEAVAACRPDWVVCAGYMRILGGGFIERFRGRLLNIHPSLLPKYRGLRTHARALEAGDTEHGTSVHFVVPELDAGAVIAQAGMPVLSGDDPQTLAQRLLPLEHRLLVAVLRLAAAGRLAERDGMAYCDGQPLFTPLRLDSSAGLTPPDATTSPMISFPLRTLLFAVLALASLPALALEPFVATYQAYNEGKLAGAARMQVVQTEGARWRVDLGIRGTRGFARLAGLNIEQSTVFDIRDEQYRPLSQATVKHAVFTGRKISGVYDWQARSARWQGDVKKTRTAAVPLQDGDMSTLLVNLAVIRDAQPGKALGYRVVDNGRARDYQYAVAAQTEIVNVDDLSYDAMRVDRTNGGNDETIFWVANGVPTPVRILQRENGQDTLDLRLVEYQGVQ